MAFFNGFAGGPARGYTHLVDSSLDWGQGLPALRDFVHAQVASREKEPGQPPLMFYISYFGLGNPTYWNLTKGEGEDYQVHHLHSSIAGVSVPRHVHEINPYVLPGYYCIGASMLQPVYNKHAPGNWNAYYEALYRRQARFLLRMLTVRDDHRSFIFSGQLPLLSDMPRMLVWMDSYRIARMGAHFKETKPYAQVCWSPRCDSPHLQTEAFSGPFSLFLPLRPSNIPHFLDHPSISHAPHTLSPTCIICKMHAFAYMHRAAF